MRTAVVGTGFGAAHLDWLTACPEIQICAIAYHDNKARAAELAARFGVPEITSDALSLARSGDFDLIVITSPPHTHAELAQAALARGKAVVSEKPLAHTIAAAEAMTEAAAGSSATASVIFQWRESPAFQAARDHVLSGELGELRFVDIVFHHDFLAEPSTPWPWRHDGDLAGAGALGDLGAHAFDLLRWTTGREWSTTSAATWTPVVRRGTSGEPIPAGTDDIADSRLITADKQTTGDTLTAADKLTGGDEVGARVLVSRVSSGLRQFSITIAGERGTLRAEGSPYDGSGLFRHGTATPREHPPTDMNPYPRLLRVLDGSAEPIPGFADGLAVQRLIDQATGPNREKEAWKSEHH